MATSALLGIFEATKDLNTALDECLLVSEDQLKTDVIGRTEQELKELIETERRNLHRAPPQDSIELQLQLIERFQRVGESAARIESDANVKLITWRPMIEELEKKEAELAQLNELEHSARRFLRAKSLVETLGKASTSWETRIENLLELIRIFNVCPKGTKLHGWLRGKIKQAMAPAKSELESEIAKALKAIKWPIADDKYDSPAASSLCRAVASLVKLQVTSGIDVEDITVYADEVVSELWGIQHLTRPSVLRFQFHFCSERSTNRVDRPEWFVAFILQCVRDTAPFIERRLQPSLAKLRSRDEIDDSKLEGLFYVDALSQFIRVLVRTAHGRLLSTWSAMENEAALICHTMDELLIGDRTLAGEFGYGTNTRYWPTMSSFFFEDEMRTGAWLRADLEFARTRLREILDSKTAWQSLASTMGASSRVTSTSSMVLPIFDEFEFATECSDAVMAMIDALGSRIDLCGSDDERDILIRTRFVEEIQCALIKEFALIVLKRPELADRFNTLRPMQETLLDWRLKPRYAGIKRSGKKEMGKTLLFGVAAKIIVKHASSSAASATGSVGTSSEEKDEDDNSTGMSNWVFGPYLIYLQNLLKEETDTETNRVFYAMTTAWRDWERRTWTSGPVDMNGVKGVSEVSEKLYAGMHVGKLQLEIWRNKLNPVDRAGLVFELGKRLDAYFVDCINRKRFSGIGAQQLHTDFVAVTELFKPFTAHGARKSAREKYFGQTSLIMRVLTSSLDDLKRLHDGDTSAFLNGEDLNVDIDVRAIARLRVDLL